MARVMWPLATKELYSGTDLFQWIVVAFLVWLVVAGLVTVIVCRGVLAKHQDRGTGHAMVGLGLAICLTAMPGFVCAMTLEKMSRLMRVNVFYKLDEVGVINLVRWMCVFQWAFGVMLFLAAYHLYREKQDPRR